VSFAEKENVLFAPGDLPTRPQLLVKTRNVADSTKHSQA
jgi:hypothetical protein